MVRQRLAIGLVLALIFATILVTDLSDWKTLDLAAKPAEAKHRFSIVCGLSGEMANNMAKMAHALAIQEWLLDYGVHTDIILRHQELPKWLKARKALLQCFPSMHVYDFEAGNGAEYTLRAHQQRDWMGIDAFKGVNSEDVVTIEATLQAFVEETKTLWTEPVGGNTTISLPFLPTDHFALTDIFVDRYLDQMREFFAFNESCCALRPSPDESVFHFRNFLHELPKRGRSMGFAELGPNQTARELFGHLAPGSKVAIVTRFASEYAQPYVDALEARGLQVRVIEGQSGVEDFCFLMSTRKEMIGIVYSTFFVWAGLLSDCRRILAYSMDGDERTQRGGQQFMHYNWTHQWLQSRVLFQLMKPDNETMQWRQRRLQQERL